MKKQSLAVAWMCSVTLLSIGDAAATDALNLAGYGPVSQAMGGSGVAYDIGPAAMMENPATLVLMAEGKYVGVGLDVVVPDIKVTNTATGESVSSFHRGRNNGPYFAPELDFVWRRDRYAFGIGAFAEGGLGTQYGRHHFVSQTATNDVDTGLDSFSRLLVLRVPFSLAWRATDALTVGASLDAVWTSLNLGLLLDTSQIGALAADRRLSGTLVPTLLGVPELSGGYLGFSRDDSVGGGADAWGIGGKLGLTYQLAADTRIGLAYNFKTDVGDLSGHSHLTAVSAVAGNIPLTGSVRIRDFQMPAQLTVGIHHEFTDHFAFAFDYQRVFWSDVMKNISAAFKQGGTGATLDILLPQNWRDVNVFAVGAEYRYDASWTFRGGLHYAQEAVPGNTLLAIVPATPTTGISAGFSYAFNEDDVIDVSLSSVLQKTLTNSSLPNTAVPMKVSHSQFNAAIAFQKKF